jgi:hypothetical protein
LLLYKDRPLETYEGFSDNNPYSSSSSIREFSKLYKE